MDAGTSILFITDFHLGDQRGRMLLSLDEVVDQVNELKPDLVMNLNDTVGPLQHLAPSPGKTPESLYLELWLEYAEKCRKKIKAPVIDVGLWRDLGIWEKIAKNPPHGTSTINDVHILWFAPENDVKKMSKEQLRWAIGEIESKKNARWIIASHAPVLGCVENIKKDPLDGSLELKAAIKNNSSAGVFAAGHYHLPHAEPRRENNSILMIAGVMNTLKKGGHSYAKKVTFKENGIVVENYFLNEKKIIKRWEFHYDEMV